jgi:hypothetical protein
MKIYLVTLPSGQHVVYSSITACLADPGNPISITARRWRQIVKESGYPFNHSGCQIDQLKIVFGKDVLQKS